MPWHDRLMEVCGLMLPEDSFVAFIQCYVDESGKFKDHTIISFCGFAAGGDRFQEFSAHWQSLLRSNGMQSLHMKKAVRFTQPLGTRKRAIGLEERKTALLSFVECARDYMETAVYVAVDVGAFNGLSGDEKAIVGDDPYYLTFQHLLAELMIYYKDPDARISVVCDDEQYYAKRCHEILAKLKAKYKEYRKRLVSISFADDEFFTGLQAADMYAYLVRCEAQVELGGNSPFPFRPLYDHLISSKPGSLNVLGGVYGVRQLHDLAVKMAKEKRSLAK